MLGKGHGGLCKALAKEETERLRGAICSYLLFSSYHHYNYYYYFHCYRPCYYLYHYICFNTFIQFIKQDKYKQLGFSPHDTTNRLFNPIHWFQFADDAAVVTTDERENQLLLNCFTKLCQRTNMVIILSLNASRLESKHFLPALFNFNPSFLSTPHFCQLLKMVNHLNISVASSILKWTTIDTKSTLNHLFSP